MNQNIILIIFVLILVLILYLTYRHTFKKIACGAIVLITGGVKTGKSLLSVELAIKEYKKRHRKWWFATHILRKDIEEPLFYTNVVISFKNYKNSNNGDWNRKPHKFDDNIMKITRKMLLRQERVAYKSVVYIQESSLCADSQEFTEKVRNSTLSLFNKLFGHSSKGGILFYDTQSVMDNHYSIKRVVSTFFFIQKSKNLFFFRVLYIREMVNNEMLTSTTNSVDDDIDFTTRRYIVWRWYYKKYDRYYFSYMTDDLPVSRTKFVYRQGFVSFSDIYNDFASGKSYDEVVTLENKRSIARSLELYKQKQQLKNGGVENG